MVPPVVKMRSFSMGTPCAIRSISEGRRQGGAVDGDTEIQEEHQAAGLAAAHSEIEGAKHGVGTDETHKSVLHAYCLGPGIPPDIAHVQAASEVKATAQARDQVCGMMRVDQVRVEHTVTAQLPLALARQ